MKPLITRKESKRYPGLFVKKYVKKVFFDNLWNQDPELIESRGHVETSDGKIVIRPFTKIFNRFENGMDIDRDEVCLYVNKINGFMAAATWVPEVNDVVISTTGSLDSIFVDIAKKYLEHLEPLIREQKYTYIFEIVDSDDPHIIPEKVGAYLIGARDVNDSSPYFSSLKHEEDLDLIANAFDVMRPHWGISRFSNIVNEVKLSHHEGVVVYGQQSGKVLKLKSPYYLTLKAIARKKDIFSLNKKLVDEEYYPLIDHLTSIGDQFTMMDEQMRLEYMRNFIQDNIK
jgi:hypothetical protein